MQSSLALPRQLTLGHLRGLVGRRSKWRAILTSVCARGSRGEEKLTPDTFQIGKRGAFFQPSPQLYNTFVEDPFLRQYLLRVMPHEVSLGIN